jgi:hypothetical protein
VKKDNATSSDSADLNKLSRREILNIAISTGIPLFLLSATGCSRLLDNPGSTLLTDFTRTTAGKGSGPLPAPVINSRSTEICLNSRISYHAGWSGTASDQWLSNILHACRKVPTTGGPIVIHIATPENVYTYDPLTHALNLHLAGDHRGDTSSAFQIGFAGDSIFDTCTAQHLAQVASTAIWNGTTKQLGSCPRTSDVTYANSNWNPLATVQTAITFGLRTVAGFKTTLKAVSTDGSLPNPSTDGAVYFDNAVKMFRYGDKFELNDLSLAQISQLLWAGYGCSAHTTSNSRAGLTVASAVANYYMTKRVYMVSHLGVHRYHNRIPPGDGLTTVDHRIEMLSSTDARTALCESIDGLPSAPAYFILCLSTSDATSRWALTDVGYCAGSMLVQSTSMKLNTHFRTDLSEPERTSIRAITGIPAGDVPIAIVSSGYRSKFAVTVKPATPDVAIPNPY